VETALCPGCNQVPGAIIGDTSFCDTEGCWVVSWDNTKGLDELMVDVGFINLGIGGEG
jgi:hypothetical protein